jgi:ATP-binding cassette subfamily C protein CydC
MRLMWRLLKLTAPYKWRVLAGLFLYVIVFMAAIVLMAVSGWFITAMALAGIAGVTMNYFTPAAIIRAMAIVRTAGRYGERLVTHDATFRLIAHLRQWAFERITPLVPADVTGWHSGDLLGALRGDMDRLESAYLRVFLPCAGALIVLLALGLFLGLFHPAFLPLQLGLLLMAGVALPLILQRAGRAYSRQLTTADAALTRHGIDYLQGMGEWQLYGAEGEFTDRIMTSSQHLQRNQSALKRLDVLAEQLVSLCMQLAVWGTIALAIPLLHSGALAPANLAMLCMLAMAAFEVVMPLPAALRVWEEVVASLQRVFAITDQPCSIQEGMRSASPATDIALDHVSFRWPNRAQPVLDDVSVHIAAGEHVALTGATGAGKSSLISLLLHLQKADSGTVSIGNVAVQDYATDTLRSQFSVAAQNPYFFAGTIADNLRLAKPDASDDELQKVCTLVQLHDFIAAQPAGYNTFVGEYGMRLSGGQKRRLALAQALLRDAPVLILDEPGEGLDAPTEAAMLNAVLDHAQGKTVVLITHCRAGLDRMQRILHLENGTLSEAG